LKLDYSKWILPLSGGYDSRAIFSLLKNENQLKCVTWGLESSLHDKDNDAFIAKELALKYGKKHKYYLTDLSDEPVEKIFHRFLVCGEGRVCDIGGYLDGFKIWKELFEEGVHGIIRGDEGFGGNPVIAEVDVRHHMRFTFFSDYTNLKELNKYGIQEQKIPVCLNRKKEESLEQWRDRINHQYEMPVVFAALNDLKLPYVEVINPLLTRMVLSVVRTLPDKLRSNKTLFRKIVKRMEPGMKFAKKDATATPDNFLYNRRVIDEIYAELKSSQADRILPVEFKDCLLDYLKQNINHKSSVTHSFKSIIKKVIPPFLKNFLRSSIARVALDRNMLAFRAYMVSKMNQMLTEDSQACQ
jgi:asparagine synthetase B (glutamine-hydrolysing)